MNILFFHGDETCPTMGGIQRTTARIVQGLTETYGHKCYSIHNVSNTYPEDAPRQKFADSRHLRPHFSAEEIAELIRLWDIDVIVNQMMIEFHDIFVDGISLSKKNCKLLYFHHTTPRRLWDTSLRRLQDWFKSTSTIKGKVHIGADICLYPFWKAHRNKQTLKKNAQDYRHIYSSVDRFVLLSERFIPEWTKLTGLNEARKLRAIPNMLSFENNILPAQIERKQKKLLLVSRLVEFPKMVSWALKIWGRITKDPRFDDWSFDIIGHGEDEKYLKSIIEERHIPRVRLLGRQDSEKYYEQSSIFLMTSIREGWGMTLTEASQKGCVPIVFDSFASVRDIIDDGVNGYLVEPFNLRLYTKKLKHLMLNDSKRRQMAISAVEMSQRYTKDKVLSRWEELLREVLND